MPQRKTEEFLKLQTPDRAGPTSSKILTGLIGKTTTDFSSSTGVQDITICAPAEGYT